MRHSRSRGAIVLIIIIVILLIAGLGLVGWRMLKSSDKSTDQSLNNTSQSSAEVILTQDDLKKAEKSLDELDFEDESVTAAEQQADL